jgi:hypothetical protein
MPPVPTGVSGYPVVEPYAAPTWTSPEPADLPDPGAAPGELQPASTSAKAIASLVLSVIYVCGLGSLAAIVLGHLARGEIRRSGGRVGGTGIASAGLVLGYIGLALTLVIGGALTVGAINDTARDTQVGQSPSPQPSSPIVPTPGPSPQQVSGVCPEVSDLSEALPAGVEYVLGSSLRNTENGIVDCAYGQPGQPGGGDVVLVAVQDDLATITVDAYWAERELAPPTAEQLGAAVGSADRFGFDEYPAPQTNVPYVDTGAARANRSVVLTVPASFDIPTPTLFATTVELLDGIRTPDNVI